MDGALEEFEKRVAMLFKELYSVGDDVLLSFPWIVKVIGVFKCCQDDFQSLFHNNQDLLKNSSVAQKYYSDYCYLSMKGVNIFKAIQWGVVNWMILVETVVSALDDESRLCEAAFHSAKISLDELAKYNVNENHCDSSSEERSKFRPNWFASRQKGKAPEQNPSSKASQFRRSIAIAFRRNRPKNLGSDKLKQKALSAQTISPSWSAFKELKEISYHLGAHKRVDNGESKGFIRASYTMTYVFYFVSWILVAVFPCQGRGLETRFYPAYNFKWGQTVQSLGTKIAREFRKEERKDSIGLLKEIIEIENCAHHIRELALSVEEQNNETKKRMDMFKGAVDALKMDTHCIDKPSNKLKNETKQRVQHLKTLIQSLKNQLLPLRQKFMQAFKAAGLAS